MTSKVLRQGAITLRPGVDADPGPAEMDWLAEVKGVGVVGHVRAKVVVPSARRGMIHVEQWDAGQGEHIAAALGLAGIGVDRTRLEIWADPAVSRNTHTIVVDSDSSRLELKIENVPTEENPRTGKIVAQSVIATLRRLVDPVVIGT